MAGTKVQATPRTPKSAKKRSRAALAAPANESKPSTDEQPKSPKTPVRHRRRASDFASKKSSSKKRQRNHATPGKTSAKKGSNKRERDTEGDEASVDEVLRQVRDLMNTKSTNAKAKALAEALKKADEIFQNDASGSSSSEDEPAQEMKETASDADMLIHERPVSATAKEGKRGLENTPRRQERASRETQRTSKKSGSGKVAPETEDGSSDEDAGPEQHKADIEALKKEDPAFYQFLEENDGSLLDFNMSDDSEQGKDPEFDNERQEPVKSVDAERSDSDTSSEDDARKQLVSDLDLRRNGTKNAQESLAGNDRRKRAKNVDVVDITGSADVSMSEESDSDDTDSIPPSESARHGMNNAGSGSESPKKYESSKDIEDATGYSDDDDNMNSEADAEAAARVEAGLEEQDASDSDAAVSSDDEAKEGKRRRKKLIFVDMKYLRELEELLKSKRSSLKACKDLLRLFRAGRDVLPTSPVSKDKKAKQAMNGKKSKRSGAHKEDPELEIEDTDMDVYKDDQGITAGKVRFASSKCYQRAMNLAIVGIQDALDKMLGKPNRKQDAVEPLEVTWDPTESGRWVHLEPIFRPYVFHLLALCDATEDADTLRFLLRRLEKLVPYTRENKVLLKKVTKVALHVWSSDPHHIGQTTRLRSYVLLTRLAHGPGNAESVLRACCNSYSSKVANVCNSKTLPLIYFACSCLVELFGIDMGASYTTAFSYLREMAVSLRAVLISKDRKQEVERIYNWSYINKLRLLSKVLGRYGSERELRPLIYPYVQICIGIMRAYPTPRTIPLRLHVASYLSDLTAATGVFIPVVPQVLSLLRCSELRKKGGHGSGSGLDWRSLLRVSDETVKTKPFLTGVINGVVYHIAKHFAIISKHVSFPEVAHFAEVALKKTAKQLVVSEWRGSLNCLAEKIHETSNTISDARSKADLSPHGAIHPDGMLAVVPGMDRARKMPIEKLFEIEDARVAKEEKLRDEKDSKKKRESKKRDAKSNGEVGGNGYSEKDQERASKKRKVAKSKKGEEDDELMQLTLDSSSDEDVS